MSRKNRGKRGGWCYIFTNNKLGGPVCDCGLFCGHQFVLNEKSFQFPVTQYREYSKISELRTVYMFLEELIVSSIISVIS